MTDAAFVVCLGVANRAWRHAKRRTDQAAGGARPPRIESTAPVSTVIKVATTSAAAPSVGTGAASTRTGEGADTGSLSVTEVSDAVIVMTTGDGADGLAAGVPNAIASIARPARKRSRR